jgi:hypothetical protein
MTTTQAPVYSEIGGFPLVDGIPIYPIWGASSGIHVAADVISAQTLVSQLADGLGLNELWDGRSRSPRTSPGLAQLDEADDRAVGHSQHYVDELADDAEKLGAPPHSILIAVSSRTSRCVHTPKAIPKPVVSV